MRPAAILLEGDARQLPLAAESVQCIVTSPPYWGLRDYGLGADTLGLEPTPEEYVARMVDVFREVRRVLRADGICWVNLGDSYSGGGGYSPDAPSNQSGNDRNGAGRSHLFSSDKRKPASGLKPKDLVGIPWRVAFALQADGWWLRADIIWAKPNPMPESITDRPTKAHEYLFLLTKSARYFYDGEAIKEASIDPPGYSRGGSWSKFGRDEQLIAANAHRGDTLYASNGARNRRSVWTIATEPYPEAHFATFPEKLVEPCILAGTSERGACPTCGAPWARAVEREVNANGAGRKHIAGGDRTIGQGWEGVPRATLRVSTLGWAPACTCPLAEPVPCRVLDPFAGSGTTVAVAERLGRVGIGVELKPTYLELARRRTIQAGLL